MGRCMSFSSGQSIAGRGHQCAISTLHCHKMMRPAPLALRRRPVRWLMMSKQTMMFPSVRAHEGTMLSAERLDSTPFGLRLSCYSVSWRIPNLALRTVCSAACHTLLCCLCGKGPTAKCGVSSTRPLWCDCSSIAHFESMRVQTPLTPSHSRTHASPTTLSSCSLPFPIRSRCTNHPRAAAGVHRHLRNQPACLPATPPPGPP